MTLLEILESKQQGLPGLGVDGDAGATGKKGVSIYIGHVKELFDSIFLTSADLGYIRIKNQKDHRTNEDSSFYYKEQSNFYRALTEEVKKMTTFSIYNLHGMYLRDGYNLTYHTLQGSYDFGKFGWSVDMKSLLNNVSSTADSDGNTKVVKEWLRSKTPEEMAVLGQKIDAAGYTYLSLNRAKIGDPSYPNPYSAEDFGKRVFDVSYGNWIDEELNDYKGVDYLKERELNQTSTNFNTNYTDDVLIPTTLSEKFKEGDILYIQDDITDKIISYIIVTPELVKCRYDYFLTVKTIPLVSLTSAFGVDEDRVQSYKKMVVSDLEIADTMRPYKNNSLDNFIRKYDKNYSLSLVTNVEDSSFLYLGGNESQLSLIMKDSSVDVFEFGSDKGIELNNLYIKNAWTNINVPVYNNDNIILADGLHIDNIEEKDFINEYKSIKLDPNKFFYAPSDTTYCGLIITDVAGNVLKTYRTTGINQLIVNYFEDLEVTDSILHMITFAGDVKTTKYFSEMSTLDIQGSTYTYSKNDTIDEVDDVYTNDAFFFSSDIITCEDCNSTVKVEAGEGVVLENLYLNDKEVANGTTINSWLTISSIDQANDGATIEFSISNNLPNEGDIDQTNIADYMKAISLSRKIGETIPETSERIVVLTAVGTKDGASVRTSYKIRQPGFSNPLNDIEVDFNPLIKNNAIEESNKSSNGILCNQVQYFTELSIKGFTNDKWGTYLDDPMVYVYVNLDNTIDMGKDTIESNFDNVHFYSKKDKNMFENNGIKVKFSWIPNSTTLYHDSKLVDLEGVEKDLSHYAESYGDSTQSTAMRNEWIYISDSSFLNIDNTEIPRDIVFKLEEGESIGGISLSDARKDEKIKIRTLVEIGNPIPMEFNFKWKVEKIEVRGKLKEEYDTSEDKEELVFFKDFFDEEGNEYCPMSENTRFVINPVYMIACPEDAESNITNTKIGRVIMNTGSEDPCMLRIGIQDIDADAKNEFYNIKHYDNDTIRLQESRGNYNHVSDIRYYWPKKRYLQDNIQNIYIYPREFKNEVANNIITKGNSPFVDLLDALEPRKNILQNMYNVSLIDVSTDINSDYSTTYLSMSYNSYIMNPVYRNEKLTFYYNNKQYAADQYNQWNSVSPMWSEQKVEIEVVDSSLLLAKQTWNHEYEISEIFSQSKVDGGVITKSGNGYLCFDSEESVEKYDTNQYSVLDIHGLQKTIDLSNEYFMSDPIDTSLAEPEDFAHSPYENCFFRTMLYDMDWIFPYFISIDNTVKVQPYYFANSYESWLDNKVMKKFFDERWQDSPEKLKEFIANSDLFQKNGDDIEYANEGRSKELYMKRKIENDVYSVKNNLMTLEVNSLKTKVNMLIPYNVVYDIYPRTMYNTDCKNTINVFMLQRPSIVNMTNYEFNKHYYDMPPYMFDDDEKNYYNEKFVEQGKPVKLVSILPPWEFNN